MSVVPTIPFDQRIRGGVYGALVGDALGVPVEFKARSYLDTDPVVDMRGWGTWNQRPGTWSDDGSLLLCTVEGLLGSFSLEKMGELYVRWMGSGYWSARDAVFDIGATTTLALERLRAGESAEHSGGDDEQHNGNGSLMRILPAGLRYAHCQREQLSLRAMAISAITHAHPRSQLACALYGAIAAEVMAGVTLREAVRGAAISTRGLFEGRPAERAWFARILDGSLFDLPRSELMSTGYVIDTLESSLWCVYQNNDYASAVLAAVNLGGDADTTGCVTGGLAGVMYGSGAIPRPWLETLPKREAIDGLLNRFVEACAGN